MFDLELISTDCTDTGTTATFLVTSDSENAIIIRYKAEWMQTPEMINGTAGQKNFIITNILDGTYEVTAIQPGTPYRLTKTGYQFICGITPPDVSCNSFVIGPNLYHETEQGKNDGKVVFSYGTFFPPVEVAFNGSAYSTTITYDNLAPGIYTYTGRDANGCLMAGEFEILGGPPPPPPCTPPPVDHVQVVGNAIIVHARPATAAPLAYSYDGGQTFTPSKQKTCLPNGTYNLVLRDTANNCDNAFTVEVTDMYGPGYYSVHWLFWLIIDGYWHSIPEPIKWDAMSNELNRDTKLHGVMYEASKGQLAFNCGAGYELLLAEYQKYGIDANVKLVAWVRDCAACDYQEDYIGRLNFTDYQDTIKTISLNVEQEDSTMLLNARLKTKVDLNTFIALDGGLTDIVEGEQIPLHSQLILKRYEAHATGEFIVIEDLADTAAERNPYIIFGFENVVSEELGKTYVYQTGLSYQRVAGEFIEVTEAGNYQLDFRLKTEVKANLKRGDFDSVDLAIYFRINEALPEVLWAVNARGVNGSFDSDNYLGGIDVQRSITLDLVPGDKLYLYGDMLVSDISGNYQYEYQIGLQPESYIKMSAGTIVSTTTARGYMAYEGIAKTLSSIMGKPDVLRSDFFGRIDSKPRAYPVDGCGALNMLFTGYLIRGIYLKPFYLSFQDLIDGFAPIYNLGVGIEKEAELDVIRVEPMTYFYNPVVVLTLDSVSGYKKTVAKELIFNQVTMGYEEKSYQNEEVNGLDAINTRREWQTPIKSQKGNYTQISKFITEGYTMELLRRIGASSDDNKRDNEIFLINLVRVPVPLIGINFKPEHTENFAQVENILNKDTVYNARITPARMFRNHSGIINSAVAYHQPEEVFKSTYAEANLDLITKLHPYAPCPLGDSETDIIAENADIPIIKNNKGYRLFTPEYIECKSKLNREQFRHLKANKYGLISLFNGREWEQAFIINVKQNQKRKICTFKLLKYGYSNPENVNTQEYNLPEYTEQEHN